jgi:hypothetical protein
MSTLEHLVGLGYRGVAWRFVNGTPSSPGVSWSKITVYEVWARGSDDAYRRFTLTEEVNGHEPTKRIVSDETTISGEEYAKAVHAYGGMRDTVEWIVERETRRQKILQFEREIALLIPLCPICHEPMVIRTRGDGLIPLLVCTWFPRKCLGRRSPPDGLLSRIATLSAERDKVR